MHTINIAAADLGFNFKGAQWAEPASINGTGFGGGAFCNPEANAFRAICGLKPV